MHMIRHALATLVLVILTLTGAVSTSNAVSSADQSNVVLRSWYKLVLELVRHTPTYSPPVASRSFAYLGVTAFEAAASGSRELQTLAGQLNGLHPLPPRETDKNYDEAVILEAALASATASLFGNTGPTGQRVLERMKAKLDAQVSADLPADVIARSQEYGIAVAAHVLNWSKDDGGSIVENMGFPQEYELKEGPAFWVPTSLVAQQQKPLLPDWGKNRAFAMPDGAACPLPAPPQYSEDKGSQFYKEALEVVDTKNNLTPEQRAIARFWSDDPMLSPTPPGHWISIALQIIRAGQC